MCANFGTYYAVAQSVTQVRRLFKMPHPERRSAFLSFGYQSNSQEAFMRKPVFLCLVLSLAVLLFSVAAWSQATNTGTVVGVVTDQSNAVVAGATVTLTDPSTGSSQSTTTNDS